MAFVSGLIFFILGAFTASFIGVVVVRLHTGQSFLSGRSRCDACNTSLSPSSLVPIVSYFITQGRARCCGARISAHAPLIEFTLGILFVLSYIKLGMTPALFGMLISLSLLLTLVLYDLQHHILPGAILYPFVVVAGVTGYIQTPTLEAFYSDVLIAVLLGFSFFLMHILSRGKALGFADAPLVFGLALLTAKAALPGIVFSFWIGAVIGIFILLGRPVGSRMGIEVPFAPYLAAGFLLAYFTQWNPFLLAALPH